MPMIKITTARRPWVGGSPRQLGDEIDVSAEDAKVMIDAGFAESLAAEEPVKRTRRPRGEAL